MKKILILSGNQNYAASTTSSTASTAVTLDIINAGAIGVFGLVERDAGSDSNDNKYCLITPTDLNTTGKIAAADFITGGGQLVDLVQGYPEFPIKAGSIQARGVTKIKKQVYAAPIKQTSFIGYNGTTGSLNLPTIVQNSDGTILAVQQPVTTSDNIREQEQYTTNPLVASETAYNILLQMINAINTASNRTQTAFITNSGTSAADWTGTGTGILLTKGSKTVAFVIESATGFVASTGTVTAGDVISIAHQNMISVTFTANILGSGAGHHIVTIGGTQYVVADAGSAAQNAQAIVDAINAGTQAKATISTADVTIVLDRSTYAAKILVEYSADDSSWSVATLTVNSTTGETVNTIAKVETGATAGATFTLDREWEGETGYFLGGTSLTLNAGVLTAGTNYGIKLIVNDPTAAYNYAKQGVLEYADITYTVGNSQGFGTGELVSKTENDLIAYRGQFDTYSTWMKQLPRFAVASTNYDVYTFEYRNTTIATGVDHNKGDNSTIQVAVPSGYAGQANFETIIKALFTQAVVNF